MSGAYSKKTTLAMCEVRILGGSGKKKRNQLGNNCSITVLNLGSDSKDEEKLMNSRYVLKVGPIEFEDKLDTGREGEMVER